MPRCQPSSHPWGGPWGEAATHELLSQGTDDTWGTGVLFGGSGDRTERRATLPCRHGRYLGTLGGSICGRNLEFSPQEKHKDQKQTHAQASS